jgi:hypothetical protein
MYFHKINALSILLLSTVLLCMTVLGNQEGKAEDFIPNDNNLDYAIANSNFIDSNRGEHSEIESPLRRFEITFIISLPFVFLTNFLALHIADAIILKDPNVNVWNNHGPFLVLNTVMITSIVSFREVSLIGKTYKAQGARDLEQRTYLSYTKPY